MHRAALVLGALVAGVLSGAPAPFPKPSRQTGPWFDGWDRPMDPLGNCRFLRRDEQLTITIPGKGHELALGIGGKWSRAPRLLRDVEGDFILDVRVGGNFLPLDDGYRHAGVLLQAGKNGAKL